MTLPHGQQTLDSMRELLKNADYSNYPNHITIMGTDRFHNTEQTFGDRFRDYRQEWVRRAREFIPGDFPLHLDFETIYGCNIRCTMCSIDFTSPKNGTHLDFNLFKKVIDEAQTYNLPSIKLNFRGEPLLTKDLGRFVRYAKEHNVLEVQINTNATLLNDQMADELIESGLDRIIFSFDAITPEVYNAIRVGADFDKTIANIQNFVARRNSKRASIPSVRIQIVCMNENKNKIIDFIDLWKDTVNRIGLIRFRDNTNSHEPQHSHKISGDQSFIAPCRQLWQRLTITSDGTVLMCCGDHKELSPVGNVLTDTIHDLWKSTRLNHIRDLHKQGSSAHVAACNPCAINKKSPTGDWSWLFNQLGIQIPV